MKNPLVVSEKSVLVNGKSLFRYDRSFCFRHFDWGVDLIVNLKTGICAEKYEEA